MLPNIFKISYVKASFPSLSNPAEYEGKPTKYELTGVLPNTSDQIEIIKTELQKTIEGSSLTPRDIKKLKEQERICFRDGNRSGMPSYENCFTLKAASARKPKLLNADGTPAQDESIFYPGCFVDMVVSFWVMNHPRGGRRILANLYGVKFVEDGEPFGSSSAIVSEEVEEEVLQLFNKEAIPKKNVKVLEQYF